MAGFEQKRDLWLSFKKIILAAVSRLNCKGTRVEAGRSVRNPVVIQVRDGGSSEYMVRYDQFLDIFGRLKQQDFITKFWDVTEGRNQEQLQRFELQQPEKWNCCQLKWGNTGGYKGWRGGSADQDMDMLSLKCLLDILVKYVVKYMSLKLEKTES